MKKLLLMLMLLLPMAGVQAQSWSENVAGENDYNHETMVYATLTTNLQDATMNDFVLAAFIDDDCRASVDVVEYPTDEGVITKLYEMRVRGDVTDDAEKTITFKVYQYSTGLEYTLSETLTFTGETQGEPSNPIEFTLTAPTYYEITFTEAELGKTYNMVDSLLVSPEGATLPDNITWGVAPASDNYGITASDYVTLDGAKLTGTKTYERSFILTLYGGTLPTTGDPSVLTYTYFNVVSHATAINILQSTYTVDKDEARTLTSFLTTESYEIVPETCTDDVYWEIHPDDANSGVVTYDGRMFTPAKGGTARVRPYVVNSKGTLYPADDAWITITVNVPVTSIELGTKENPVYSFYANVGDQNIYSRLANLINVNPVDASNKAYTLSFSNREGTEGVSAAGETVTATASGTWTLTITSVSNPSVSASLDFVVENPAKTATFAANPLYVTITDDAAVGEADAEGTDISQQVMDNITFDGEMYYSNANIEVAGADAAGGTVAGAVTGYGYYSNDGKFGNFYATQEGTSTISVTIYYKDYDSCEDNGDGVEEIQVNKTFDVIVSKSYSLAGLIVNYTETVAGESGEVNFTPYPKNATYDVSDLNFVFSTSPALPDTWADVFVADPATVANEGTTYIYQSAIPLYVSINVTDASGAAVPLYLDENQTLFYGFEIGQRQQIDLGWSWCSNPYGYVKAVENTFAGAQEIRTQSEVIYNDSQWGFFGNFSGIGQAECYKINMVESSSIDLFGGTLAPTTMDEYTARVKRGTDVISLSKGWTWVGSPYFYDRTVESVLGATAMRTLASAGLDISLADLKGVKIVGRDAFCECSGTAWEGKLTVLESGKGYIIYNPNSDALNISFIPEFINQVPEDAASVKAEGFAGNVWKYDASKFMNNMSIVGVLEGIEHPEDYTIGAFVNGECRGEGIVKNGKAFITVHSNGGEVVNFKLYNTLTGETADIDEAVRTQTILGSLDNPFTLHSEAVTAIGNINAATRATETYDLSGRRITGKHQGVSVQRMNDGTFRKSVVK